MKPQFDRYCPRCELFTMAVVYSKPGKLGRSRTRRCLNCKHERRTLETEVIPGLRRAVRRLRKALGVQLPLPF